MPTSSISLADDALAYAQRGILIFPLWHVTDGVCACSDGPDCGSPGKHPRTRRGLTEATNNPSTIARWWAAWPHANIGMPAGANGLAVIDVDPRHGGADTIALLEQYCRQHGVDLFATRHIRTGSGGDHLIHWQPPGGIISKAKAFGADAPGVDTRGRGGYIVAPPSLHASGGRYEVIDNGCSIAPWPACLTARMESEPPAVARLDPALPADVAGDLRGQRWASKALDAEVQELAALTTATGDRNNRLNIAAYKIGRRVGAGYLDETAAADALYDACRGWQGHTARELTATIRSGMRAGMGNPHPGPATKGGAQ